MGINIKQKKTEKLCIASSTVWESPVLRTMSEEKRNWKYSFPDYKKKEDMAPGKNFILWADC